MERFHAANAVGAVTGHFISVIRLDNPGHRQVICQFLADTNGPASRATAAVGCGECFVQVDMDDIKPEITGTGLPQKSVGIGAITVKQPSPAVNNGGDPFDVPFKEPQGVGIGQHHSRDLLRHQFLKMVDIHAAFGICPDGNRPVAAKRARCRVGSMSGIRYQYGRPPFFLFFKVFFHDHDARQFTVSAGSRLQRKRSHAEDF